jgi:hypothetical protein
MRPTSVTRTAIEIASKCYSFNYPFVCQINTADGRPLKSPYIPKVCKSGYPVISFRRRKLGITMKILVHQIVAYQKYGEKMFQEELLCRHKNNDKTDFRSENIILGTSLDNHNDNPIEMKRELIRNGKKSARSLRTFTDQQVREIRSLYQNGHSVRSLSGKYNVAFNTIRYMVKRLLYKDVL